MKRSESKVEKQKKEEFAAKKEEFAAKRLIMLDTAIAALTELGPHRNYGILSSALRELEVQKRHLQA